MPAPYALIPKGNVAWGGGVRFGGRNGSGERSEAGQRGLRVVDGVDLGAAVGVEVGRGVGGVMPDQRVWWKRASI
jgi:hypothetical protein